jgi:threonine/homoserine/homoserine lactone efflux protein
MVAAIVGLAALLYTSSLAFQTLKFLGVRANISGLIQSP